MTHELAIFKQTHSNPETGLVSCLKSGGLLEERIINNTPTGYL